jgi:hypothetical protein
MMAKIRANGAANVHLKLSSNSGVQATSRVGAAMLHGHDIEAAP